MTSSGGVTLDGPRLGPASGSAPRGLVVLLHGYGSDGNDLIQLGAEWQKMLPDVAFVSPHAPERCAQSPSGYQWFDLTFRDPNEYWRGVNQAGPVLDAFLDAELERTGVPENRMVLAGFSQGTMMGLHVGLRRKTPCAGILGYSGALAGGEHLKSQITSKPPILLSHGDQDDVIPFQMMFLAAQAIAAADHAVCWHVAPRIQHGIDGGSLLLGGRFLRDCLTVF